MLGCIEFKKPKKRRKEFRSPLNRQMTSSSYLFQNTMCLTKRGCFAKIVFSKKSKKTCQKWAKVGTHSHPLFLTINLLVKHKEILAYSYFKRWYRQATVVSRNDESFKRYLPTENILEQGLMESRKLSKTIISRFSFQFRLP